MKKILHVVDIKAPRHAVYAALTTEEGLSNWWSTNVKADVQPGGIVDFRFLGDFNPDMEITELEEGTAVGWRCVAGHDNWHDNTFAFELSDVEHGTRLKFTQVYATELSDEVYGTYNYNWGYYLDSLREYCETGEGKPFQA